MRLRWIIAVAVVVAVVGAGLFAARVRAERERIEKASAETALRDELAQMRKAIASFRADNGRYPQTLDELLPKYLRRIPTDPMTKSSQWRLTTEETVEMPNDFGGLKPAAPQGSVIIDVHSSAPGYGDY